MTPATPIFPETKARVISVASGKGGAGKTNVTVNLAWALAEAGRRVCIFDADLGLSNVDILLGVEVDRTLDDVLFRGLPMADAVIAVAPNIDLVSGSSGVARMAELSRAKRAELLDQFRTLDGYDYILVDNSPGISPQVLSLCLSSREMVVVVNPEAGSITDAYALIKVLHESGLRWPPLLLVNRARSQAQARRVFERIRSTARKYLQLNIGYLGSVPEDGVVANASAMRRAAVELFPASEFSRALGRSARALDANADRRKGHTADAGQFWDASVMRVQQRLGSGSSGGRVRSSALPPLRPLLEGLLGDMDFLGYVLDEALDDASVTAESVTSGERGESLNAGRARLAKSRARLRRILGRSAEDESDEETASSASVAESGTPEPVPAASASEAGNASARMGGRASEGETGRSDPDSASGATSPYDAAPGMMSEDASEAVMGAPQENAAKISFGLEPEADSDSPSELGPTASNAFTEAGSKAGTAHGMFSDAAGPFAARGAGSATETMAGAAADPEMMPGDTAPGFVPTVSEKNVPERIAAQPIPAEYMTPGPSAEDRSNPREENEGRDNSDGPERADDIPHMVQSSTPPLRLRISHPGAENSLNPVEVETILPGDAQLAVNAAAALSQRGVLSGGRGTALIVCPDPTLRDVLSDIVRVAGLIPEFVLQREGRPISVSGHRLCIVTCNRPDFQFDGVFEEAGTTPVILIDGSYGHAAQTLRRDQGVAEVIAKPFEVSELLDAIRRHSVSVN